MSKVLGLVLAGGQASRMAGEKALRLLRGQTLLEHALVTLATACDILAVSSGTRELKLPKGVPALPDMAPFVQQGPLSGILAGFEYARAQACDRMLVLACDLPNVPPALLKLLLTCLPDQDVAFCEHGGQPEPLVCALRVEPMFAKVKHALLENRLKVVPLWKAARCGLLVDADLANLGSIERIFANVNTLDELSREEQANP